MSVIGLILVEYSMTFDLSRYVKFYLIPIHVYQNLSCGYWQGRTLLMSAEIISAQDVAFFVGLVYLSFPNIIFNLTYSFDGLPVTKS